MRQRVGLSIHQGAPSADEPKGAALQPLRVVGCLIAALQSFIHLAGGGHTMCRQELVSQSAAALAPDGFGRFRSSSPAAHMSSMCSVDEKDCGRAAPEEG